MRLILIYIFAALSLNLQASETSSPSKHTQNCKACHSQIYKEWQSSWMARAYSNENFQLSYQQWKKRVAQSPEILKTNPLATPKRCLECHSPLSAYTEDQNKESGVTCQACHAVRRTRHSATGHDLVFDHRDIIYTANERPDKNTPHRTKYNQDLANSRLCAGCHQDRLPNGLFLERTYDEWLNSRYAKQGINCSSCHMPQTQGPATDGITSRTSHASHRFAGGHADSPLLANAATVELTQTSKPHRIDAIVKNAAVGHNFPTGGAHPNKLILLLSLKDSNDQTLHQERRVYRYKYLDDKGQPLPPKKLQDTTLRPLESRKEAFFIPKHITADKAVARLEYHIIPEKIGKKLDPNLFQTSYAPTLIDEAVLELN